jgi:nuclear pore complex protein Nup93
MAMVSAVQEAQKDNLRSFNDYMMKVLEVSVILPFLSWHT